MAWAEGGHDPEQFWRLTLRQVVIVLEGDANRRFHELQLQYYGAYMAGFFSQPWGRKFPKYSRHAPTRKAREPQSWQQMQMMAKALNAAFGGTFETRH